MNLETQLPTTNPVEPDKVQQQRHSLRLNEIWKIIKYRRLLVGLILGFAVLGTFLGHFIYTPTYTAVTVVGIKTEKPTTMADVLGAPARWAESNIGERIHNYVQYLKSNSFLLEVAQTIKFKNWEQPLIFETPENLSMFKKDFWIWAFQYLTGGKIEKAQNKYDPMSLPVEKIAEFLSSVTTIQTNHADHISINVKTLDSFTSMTIANVLTKEFARITNEHDSRGLLEVKKLVENKLDETKESLKKAELELIEFKKQNRVSITAAQSTIYSDRINDIEKQIEGVQLKLEENKKLLEYFRKAQETRIQESLATDGKATDSSIRTQIALLNQKLDGLRKQKSLMASQNYEADHWRMQEVSVQINEVAQELKSLMAAAPKGDDAGESTQNIQARIDTLNRENRDLENKLEPLQNTKNELMQHLTQIPQAEQYQLMLERKVNLEYENFSLLRKKMNDIEIQLVSLDKKVLIDRLATPPGPSQRRSLPLKLIFSGLIGLFFGSLIALMLEYLDTSIRHKSDLEDLGIHFLGEIPDTGKGAKRKVNVKSPEQLVTLNSPDSLDSVVFDFVRSRLESFRTRTGRSSGSLTVTSVRPGEGKSFISCNLAVSLSQLGKKTLLIDADLRCPSVHCYFNLSNDQGLTDLFESDVGLDEVLQKNVAPNLDVFTAGWGCKNPTVLVSSEKFRFLMKFLRNEYDYIIVDTPPIGAVADASIISNMTDGLAIVAKYRQTTKFDIQDAQFKIHQMSSKRLFGIINFASNRENIVTYYPYMAPRSNVERTQTKYRSDDIRRFEEQLKRKKLG